MENEPDKRQFRLNISALKKQYSNEKLYAFSEKIHARIEQSPLFSKATYIACYHALPGEVHTTAFLEKWYKKKRILLPAVDGEQLKLYPYQGESSLKIGTFGIMEPRAEGETVSPENVDFAIIPGIAFDRQLNRLGRGKGFYDRFLSGFRNPIIGICFHFQLFDAVPVNAHDHKMTQIITEQEIIGEIDHGV